MLDICVAGWYLEKFDDFYMSLHRIKKRHPVFVVSNKDSDYLKTFDLPYVVRENTGLEWGAYNHFLMNIWEGENGVLFCHDDIEINPVIVDGVITPPEYLFDRIDKVGVDQAYIFGSRHEDVENYGKHGRMVYMSQAFLTKVKEVGGFWYDDKNKGYTNGEDADLRAQYDCFGYNAGINAFHAQAQGIGGNIHRKIYIPAFTLAKRGAKGSEAHQYGKWSDRISHIVDSQERKLHVGSGDNYFATHTNVDLYNDKADIKADAKSIPVADGSFDLVESHHLIEHLNKPDAILALKEWLRILSPGGYVFITCPDIVALTDALRGANAPELWDGLMQAIYGEDDEGMHHRYGYSRESLTAALINVGFVEVEVKTAIGYRPTPSLLAIARKP